MARRLQLPWLPQPRTQPHVSSVGQRDPTSTFVITEYIRGDELVDPMIGLSEQRLFPPELLPDSPELE
jgi:hypothetical protein